MTIMPYKNKEDYNAHMREYMPKYRKNNPNIVKKWDRDGDKKRRIRNKLAIVKFHGGQCKKCSYNKNLAALELHHPEGIKKEKQFKMIIGNSSVKRALEVTKNCILLCSNCHKEKHHPDYDIENFDL